MIKDSKLLRAALIFIACTSFIVCGVQPIFMGLITERLSLPLDLQGWVVSVEMIGMTLGTLLCPLLMKRHGGRSLCLFVGMLCVALSIATAFATTSMMLLVVRMAAGACAGLAYAYAVTTLGRLPDQDRSFGLMLLLQTPEYSLFSAALPLLAAQSGAVTALCSFGLWYLLICAASLVLPRRPAAALESGEGTPAQGGSARTGRSALVGMLFMQVAIYCVWGFIDQLARDQGIGGVDIGWAFGLSAIGGLPGAALPSLLGARVNRQLMIAVGLVAVFVSIAMLTGHALGQCPGVRATGLLAERQRAGGSCRHCSVGGFIPCGNPATTASIRAIVSASRCASSSLPKAFRRSRSLRNASRFFCSAMPDLLNGSICFSR